MSHRPLRLASWLDLIFVHVLLGFFFVDEPNVIGLLSRQAPSPCSFFLQSAYVFVDPFPSLVGLQDAQCVLPEFH